MATDDSRGILLLFRIGVPLLVLANSVSGGTRKATLREGGSIQVTCPNLPQGKLLATSFIKKLNDHYVTFFSRRGSGAFQPRITEGDMVSLDESSLVMTVSKLGMKDNGATYTCKLFSTTREVYNSVIVTVTVPPRINFSVSPAPPYKDRTAIASSCTVERVSPALKPGGMTLGIAGQPFKDVAMTRNQDGTFRYTITRRHMVTKKDDNKKTSCKVVTAGGKHHMKEIRIQLVRPPSGKPRLSSSKTVLHPGDLLKLTCNLAKKGIPNAHKYTWYKNGRAFKNTDGATHTLKVTSEASAGSFSCKGTNTEGASDVSMPKCVAFTKEYIAGSPIAVWISVVSFLLNIAAAIFIIMIHIKPRVDEFMANRQLKSLKKLKEESGKKDNPEAEVTDLQKPTDSAHSFDSPIGVPNNLVQIYDQVDDEKKDPEQLMAQAPPHQSSEKHPEQLSEQLPEQLPEKHNESVNEKVPLEAETPEVTADIRL